MVEYNSVNRIKDSRGIEMTRPESTPPTIDSNVTLKNRPENFTPVSTPMTSLEWRALIRRDGRRWKTISATE